MSDKDLKYRIGADDRDMLAALNRVNINLQQLDGRMSGMLGGIQGHFSRATSAVTALAGVIATGALSTAFQSAINMQDRMSESAQRVGMSTEAFSAYAYAAKLSGLETDDLSKSIGRLSTTLIDAQSGQKQAVSLFKQLKIDPAGVKDTDELLLRIADRFQALSSGAAKTSLAVEVFGEKLGPKMVPLLNEGRAGIERLKEEAARLGVVVSTEAGEQAAKLNDNFDRMKTAAIGAGSAVASDLAPSLIKATEFFTAATKEAGFFQAVLISIGAIMARGLGIDERGQLETALKSQRAEADRLRLVMIGLGNVLANDPNNESAKRRFDNLSKQLREVLQQALNTSAAIGKIGAGGKDAGAGRGSVNPANAIVPQPSDGSGDGGKAPGSGSGSAKAAPAAAVSVPLVGPEAPAADWYEQQLQVARLSFAELNGLRELSKQDEADYWRDVLNFQALAGKDRLAVELRWRQAQLEANQEAAQQSMAVEREAASGRDVLDLARIERRRQEADRLLQSEQIGQSERLAMEQQFEEQRFQIQSAALQSRLASVDPTRDPVQYQQLLNEILLLEEQHVQAVAQVRDLAQIQGQQSAMQIGQSLQGAFASVLSQVGTSIRGIGDLVRSLASAVLQSITQMLAQMAAKWLANKLMMKLTSKAFAMGEIATEAGKAGAAGVASWAAAPWPINAGAPAFGAAMAAAAMSYAPMASAAGGYDIPAGVNPLTQLHAREMVLPQAQADAVRDMAAGGGRAGLNVTLQGIAMPGGYFSVHQDEFVRFFKELQRDRHI